MLSQPRTKAGEVVGTSDKQAAYPVEHPVSSGDLAATIYHLLGVDLVTGLGLRVGRANRATKEGPEGADRICTAGD
jgi:hypothetical protein